MDDLNYLTQVSVLGVKYKVFLGSEKDLQRHDGFCQSYEKRLVVRCREDMLPEDATPEARYDRFQEVVTHELIHAFLHESGLENLSGVDEEFIAVWVSRHIFDIIACASLIYKEEKLLHLPESKECELNG